MRFTIIILEDDDIKILSKKKNSKRFKTLHLCIRVSVSRKNKHVRKNGLTVKKTGENRIIFVWCMLEPIVASKCKYDIDNISSGCTCVLVCVCRFCVNVDNEKRGIHYESVTCGIYL